MIQEYRSPPRFDEDDRAWLDYQQRFADVYDDSAYAGGSLQSWVMRQSHKLGERPFGSDAHFSKVLEIGAGTGEHVPFIRHSFDEYVLTDLDAKTLEIAAKKLTGQAAGKIIFEAQQGSTLPYPDDSFDRVIASHVLEHIYQPHLALREWRRVAKDDGVLTVILPTDPGLAWRLGKRLGPRKNAIARGIAYDYVMAREHVNSCINLIAILRHYFPESAEAWWPLPLPSVDLNLFFVFHATIRK